MIDGEWSFFENLAVHTFRSREGKRQMCQGDAAETNSG